MTTNKKEKLLTSATKKSAITTLLFIVSFASFLLANQLWKLQTPDVLRRQLIATGIVAVFFILLAIFSFKKRSTYSFNISILLMQSLIYVAFVSYAIYNQRGMASTAVILYAIPIISIAISRTAVAIFTVSAASIFGYTLATFKYFQDFPSEGYKIELYGQIAFYSFVLLLIAYAMKIVLDYFERRNN